MQLNRLAVAVLVERSLENIMQPAQGPAERHDDFRGLVN